MDALPLSACRLINAIRKMKANCHRLMLVGDLPPPVHGQSLSFRMLCRALPSRGFDCRIVDLGRKKTSPYSRMSMIRVIEICKALARFVYGLVLNYRRIYILISQSRVGFIRDMLMIWSAWLCGCRIVVHLRGGNYDGFYRGQSKLWRFLIRHTLRRVDRIIVLSERLRDMYGFDPALQDQIVVVTNSSPEKLEGKPRHWNGRTDTDRPVRLLYLSNMIQSKGYHDALEAVAILQRTTTIQLEAIFAGQFFSDPCNDKWPMSLEEAKANFLDRIEADGLSNIVRYVGPVAGEEKWHLLETSDFFLLPTYYQEGVPISIIEAMAHGCLVITTNFRSSPDLVADGETGILVEHGRPEQIADAVRRIASDPKKYTMMSKAAVERYKKNFSMERHLDTIISVLETM